MKFLRANCITFILIIGININDYRRTVLQSHPVIIWKQEDRLEQILPFGGLALGSQMGFVQVEVLL